MEILDKNNFYIRLEKGWFYTDEEQTLLQKYDSVSLVVYSLLLRTLTARNTFTLNMDWLYSTLNINKKDNGRMVSKVKESITKLNGNLFSICIDSNCNIKADVTKINNKKTYYCINLSEILKEKYFMVYDNEIDEMIKYSKSKKNSLFDLITHYSFICNGFTGMSKKDLEEKKNCEGYLCYYGGLDYIERKTGIIKSTLLSNNTIFTELKLLLIGNAGGNIDDDKYTNTSNIYARYGNKKEFDEFMEIKKKSIGKKFETKEDKVQQDKQRQLKQLINNYKKEHNIDNKTTTKDDLSIKEFEELYYLEINYLNFVLSRGKEPNRPYFKTIQHDGTITEQYDSETGETILFNPNVRVIEVDKKEDIDIEMIEPIIENEKSTPKQYDSFDEEKSDDWEGNQPMPNFKDEEKIVVATKKSSTNWEQVVKEIESDRPNKQICVVNDPNSTPEDVLEEYNKPPEIRIQEARIRQELDNQIEKYGLLNPKQEKMFESRFKGVQFHSLKGEEAQEMTVQLDSFFRSLMKSRETVSEKNKDTIDLDALIINKEVFTEREIKMVEARVDMWGVYFEELELKEQKIYDIYYNTPERNIKVRR